MSLLSVTGLAVSQTGRRPAGTVKSASLLRDVSFELAAGERLGLIGESGSGKSLTALALTGLLAGGLAATGSVLLDGVQVVGAAERTLVGLRGRVAATVFQDPLTALDPLMRLGAQLAEPLRRHRGLRKAALATAVHDALAEVSLDETERIIRSYPHEISGGQRQRVAIAMALACRPQLLIADEPTTALDVTVQDGVLALLDRIVAERGMALLFVSHDLAVVARMTDRVLVLQRGDVVESGPLQRLLRAPEHPYTAELVRSARTLDTVLDVAPRAAGAAS
ncbi:ABC transporter ATP-binding protein [Cryobacterium sp. SO2]|uniref:ABC transporter ATP-binding protein n=1 Tax=Cryobacterium sp. SO2 TaxID=1897060 RepID=UPI00223E6DA1|nr:ABC transporter ATP-binding protein [Cryobacterium sp. SO2]WEO78195.1 ABC transporter ATP-binding protein [Cryobacterium sp. SO2]